MLLVSCGDFSKVPPDAENAPPNTTASPEPAVGEQNAAVEGFTPEAGAADLGAADPTAINNADDPATPGLDPGSGSSIVLELGAFVVPPADDFETYPASPLTSLALESKNRSVKPWWDDSEIKTCLRTIKPYTTKTLNKDPSSGAPSERYAIKYIDFESTISNSHLFIADASLNPSLQPFVSTDFPPSTDAPEALCRKLLGGLKNGEAVTGISAIKPSRNDFDVFPRPKVVEVHYDNVPRNPNNPSQFILACHEVCKCAVSANKVPAAFDEMPEESFYLAEKTSFKPILMNVIQFNPDQLLFHGSITMFGPTTFDLWVDDAANKPLAGFKLQPASWGGFTYTKHEVGDARVLPGQEITYRIRNLKPGREKFVSWNSMKSAEPLASDYLGQQLIKTTVCPCDGSIDTDCTFIVPEVPNTADGPGRVLCMARIECTTLVQDHYCQ